MFAIVFACILGFVVTVGSDADEDGFVALLVQEQASCGNGDEFKGGDDMSIQECADHCGGAGTIFFAHKSDGGACWCAGVEDEEGGVCGWSDVGTSAYNVYIAASTPEDVVSLKGGVVSSTGIREARRQNNVLLDALKKICGSVKPHPRWRHVVAVCRDVGVEGGAGDSGQ